MRGLTLISVCLILAIPCQAQIIYVDDDANDPNSYHNGTSWFNAYTDLQDALLTARKCGCEQIWVADGTYKPTKAVRSISF